MLFRSLSSGSRIVNPGDDAGGLGVSIRLSAAAKRSGAVAANLGNATSFLQTQDGVLKVAGKVLERMSEMLFVEVLRRHADAMPADQQVATARVTELTDALMALEIVDVHPFSPIALQSAGSLNVTVSPSRCPRSTTSGATRASNSGSKLARTPSFPRSITCATNAAGVPPAGERCPW